MKNMTQHPYVDKNNLVAINLNLREQAQKTETKLPYVNEGGFGAYVGVILSGLMGIAAVIVFIQLLWGAFDWINSSNEKGKLDSARNKMTGAIVGLFVLSGTIALFMLIQQVFGITIISYGS